MMFDGKYTLNKTNSGVISTGSVGGSITNVHHHTKSEQFCTHHENLGNLSDIEIEEIAELISKYSEEYAALISLATELKYEQKNKKNLRNSIIKHVSKFSEGVLVNLISYWMQSKIVP